MFVVIPPNIRQVHEVGWDILLVFIQDKRKILKEGLGSRREDGHHLTRLCLSSFTLCLNRSRHSQDRFLFAPSWVVRYSVPVFFCT